MKTNQTSNFFFKAALLFFIAVLTLVNYQALASEKNQNNDFNNPFYPLYPTDEDYKAFNQEIAQKVGLDLEYSCPMKIAVIDSGVDAGVESLQGKICLYRNYTADGTVKLEQAQKGYGNAVYLTNQSYNLGTMPENTEYYLGQYDLSDYPYLKSQQKYDILLERGENLLQVYVDTDNDLDFSDEKAIGLYNESGDYLSLKTAKGSLNLVLSAVDDDNKSLQLSCDYLGHGTFIANLLSGESEDYQGLVKDSELLVYQIFEQDGQASQSNLAKSLNDALNDGADLINLSLSLPLKAEPSAELLQALQNAAAKNIPIIAAAGNNGTNADSISYPAKAENVLAVGALITKEGYSRGRGINLLEDFVASYSPRAGEHYTNFVLAPACAVSAVPQWFGEKYMFDEGSSVAAAVATACAAQILKQGAPRENFVLNLAQAAKSLGYDWHIQGLGLVQADWLKSSGSQIELYQEKNYIRLENKDDESHEVFLFSDQDWLEVPYRVIVEGKSTNYLPIKENLSQKGYNTALVRSQIGPDRLYSTDLCYISNQTEKLEQSLKCQFDLKAGKTWDYYWRMESGDEAEIKLSLEKLAWDDKSLPHGRIMAEVCAPNGQVVQRVDYFGISFAEKRQSEATVTITDAQEGLWRVSIISSESLPLYNQLESYGWVTIIKK